MLTSITLTMRVAGFRRLIAGLVDPGVGERYGSGPPAPTSTRPFTVGRHSGPLVAGQGLGISSTPSASDHT